MPRERPLDRQRVAVEPRHSRSYSVAVDTCTGGRENGVGKLCGGQLRRDGEGGITLDAASQLRLVEKFEACCSRSIRILNSGLRTAALPRIRRGSDLMTSENATHAKQSKVRIGSSLRLIAFLASVSTLIYLLVGSTWLFRLLLMTIAFFLVATAFEVINVMRTKWRVAREQTIAVSTQDPFFDFTFVSSNDEDWYQARVRVNGELVIVQISPRAFPAALPYARKIVDAPMGVATKFKEFKLSECSRNQRYVEEIQNLQLDSIDFVSDTSPQVAEVSFRNQSCEPWSCVWDNESFRDLILEV